MSDRWASLGGWHPDPDRPGFLRHPEYMVANRTPDGRWWSTSDVDGAIEVVREAGRVVRLLLPEELAPGRPSVRASDVRQARLATTPADRASNERAFGTSDGQGRDVLDPDLRARILARIRERLAGRP